MAARRFRAGHVVAVSDVARPEEPDIDLFALMSGKCSTVKIAGRDFACRAVAYFHSQQGRANFTIALDDPDDASHVVSFSGESGRRDEDNLYELSVDQMQFYSRDTPKVEGLPVPLVERSVGTCRQVGSFSTRQVSTVACTATDKGGRKYELRFESDGSPMTIRKIKQAPLRTEALSARQIEQRECRTKAVDAMVLRRDLTDFLLRCLDEGSQDSPPTAQ